MFKVRTGELEDSTSHTPSVKPEEQILGFLPSWPNMAGRLWARGWGWGERGWGETRGGGKETTPCLPELRISLPKKNNRDISNSWPPSILSQTQRQRPIMQNRFYRKAGGWGGMGSLMWGVFPFFFFFPLNPIRDLIIISLLAEKPNKWQEKESQLNINAHTHTHKDERCSELQSSC